MLEMAAMRQVDDRPQILIIDDSVEIIQSLSILLNDKASILFATSPERGMQLAYTVRPELILLDVEMPGMNGFEVCRRLRADPINFEGAIIFITGHTNSAHEVAALEAGAIDFLSKPLVPAVVRARIHTHLSLIEKTRLLTRLAQYDSLTGIYNRRYFDMQLEEEFRRHQRHSGSLGVAIIDIDHFKAYNDGYGHVKGDGCLRDIARLISSVTRRPGEVVARYGGEEFAVILPSVDESSAKNYGEWLCEQVRKARLTHAFSSVGAGIATISVGVATFMPGPEDIQKHIVELADQALYRAKTNGRNRSECYCATEIYGNDRLMSARTAVAA